MCSIAGYITTKKYSRFAQEKFEKILLAGEVRGTDACGIAFNTGKNRFYYMKAPKPASEFITEKIYTDLIGEYDPTLIIGHNRQKTQGDEKENKNNHPIITKTGLSLIHNGMIYNDTEVAKDFGLKLDGEVDSEVIVRLIEYYICAKGYDTMKAIKLTAQKVRGGLAFALLNAKEPHTAYLLASENPLTLAYHKPTGTIFWASTEDILKKGLIQYDYYFKGFFRKIRSKDDYVFEDLEDDTGIKLTTRGWEMFSVKRPEYQSNYQRGHYGGYGYDDEGYPVGSSGVKPIYASQRPIEVEAKDEEEIKKVLAEQVGEFDEYEEIDKPSNYLSELLLMRLEAIQDLILTGGDFDKYGLEGDEEVNKEVRRIIDTLTFRQKKTEREIYIPTLEEVLLLGKKKGSKGLEKVGWILAEKNPELFDLIETAKEEKDEEEKIETIKKNTEQKKLLN